MVFTKGQVAMEFLMTYGWAFLVVLGGIGALAYFGLLEADSIAPERCEFGGQGLSCLDVPAVDGSAKQVLLLVKNNVGQTITLKSVSVTDDCTLSSFTFCNTNSSCEPAGNEKDVANREEFIIKIICSEDFGRRFTSDITVTYTNIETGFDSYNLAQVRGNVN